MSRIPTTRLPCGHFSQHADAQGVCSLCAVDFPTRAEVALAIEAITAETRRLLALIEQDMHQASARPCVTCQAVSAAVGCAWGCCAVQERLAHAYQHTARKHARDGQERNADGHV